MFNEPAAVPDTDTVRAKTVVLYVGISLTVFCYVLAFPGYARHDPAANSLLDIFVSQHLLDR